MLSIKELRLTQLMIRYRNNDLTPAEFEEFLNLMAEIGPENMLDSIAEGDWEESKVLLRDMNVRHAWWKFKFGYKVWIPLLVAASVVVVVSLYNHLNLDKQADQSITHQTAYGETKRILLPDSSKVLLNANTRLSWDADWKEKGIRRVILDGEAFFEVKKEHGIEFIVESGSAKVKVLGTVFNVRNRRGLTEVFLKSGKVNLELEKSDHKLIHMEPGNVVHYNDQREDLTIEKSSTLIRSASWVEGMLEFKNEPLVDILHHFEELYGKKFQIENKALLNKRMDLSLPYANWDLIRRVLEISLDVEFVEKNDMIIVT